MGGAFYQRTVLKARTLTLIGVFTGRTLRILESKQFNLYKKLQPNVLTQKAAILKIRFRMREEDGSAVGTPLEMLCTFAGNVEVLRDNLYQEKVGLVFTEYNPPNIRELNLNTSALTLGGYTSRTPGIAQRTSSGAWSFSGNAAVWGIDFKADGTLCYGGDIDLKIGATSTTPNLPVYSMLVNKLNTRIYAAGQFTQLNAVAKARMAYTTDNGVNWTQVSAALNNTVRFMTLAQNGTIYAGGDFTAPTTRVFSYDGTTISALGTGINGSVYCCIQGNDNYMYFGGTFTSANGVACNNIVLCLIISYLPKSRNIVPIN